MKLACEAVGSGVVYISIPQENFGEKLLATFFTKHARWNFINQTSGSAKIDMLKALEMIKEGADKYKRATGKLPVLVIDDVNYLAEKSPDLLESLQLFAKDCADGRALYIIFVSTDGLAPSLLQSNILNH